MQQKTTKLKVQCLPLAAIRAYGSLNLLQIYNQASKAKRA